MPAAITDSERLPAIDLARGIAMIGVALVNVHAFAAVWASVYGLDLARGAGDVAAEYLTGLLFTHRSYPVLAFLFGAGLAWQWQRLPIERRWPNALRARLWVLLAFGVVQGLLLWPGDVLAAYGCMGLIAVSLLRFSDRALGFLTIGAYAGVVLVYTLTGAVMLLWPQPPWPLVEPAASFSMPSAWQALLTRRSEFIERGLAQALVPDFWAHVLFGMWAARSGALSRFLAAPLASPTVVIVGALSLILASAVELLGARYGGWDVRVMQDRGWGLMTMAIVWASLGGLWGWLTVAALWARAAESTALPWLRSLVSAAGRAPLTQFIGQSLIFATVFNESALGLHGHVGRGWQAVIALATYLLLCLYIRAWFSLGQRYGPVEIAWRRLTNWLSPPPAPIVANDSESRTP